MQEKEEGDNYLRNVFFPFAIALFSSVHDITTVIGTLRLEKRK